MGNVGNVVVTDHLVPHITETRMHIKLQPLTILTGFENIMIFSIYIGYFRYFPNFTSDNFK